MTWGAAAAMRPADSVGSPPSWRISDARASCWAREPSTGCIDWPTESLTTTRSVGVVAVSSTSASPARTALSPAASSGTSLVVTVTPDASAVATSCCASEDVAGVRATLTEL